MFGTPRVLYVKKFVSTDISVKLTRMQCKQTDFVW